jgi:c-di-GMP-binding flagellar brake protein YcgR
LKIDELTIGIKLELEIYDEMGECTGPQLVSELEWAEDAENACIAAPILEGIIYPVRVGYEIAVYFLYKFDAYNYDLYSFRAKVTGRGQKDNLALLNIHLESGIERIRRRQFFRFDCTVPVEYRVKSIIQGRNDGNVPFIKASSRDMSGGGVCILAGEQPQNETLLECRLNLGDDKWIEFLGKAVRIERLVMEQEVKYSIGVLFHIIEDKDREAIIHYIFKEQRKLRQKGLI